MASPRRLVHATFPFGFGGRGGERRRAAAGAAVRPGGAAPRRPGSATAEGRERGYRRVQSHPRVLLRRAGCFEPQHAPQPGYGGRFRARARPGPTSNWWRASLHPRICSMGSIPPGTGCRAGRRLPPRSWTTLIQQKPFEPASTPRPGDPATGESSSPLISRSFRSSGESQIDRVGRGPRPGVRGCGSMPRHTSRKRLPMVQSWASPPPCSTGRRRTVMLESTALKEGLAEKNYAEQPARQAHLQPGGVTAEVKVGVPGSAGALFAAVLAG